MNQITWTARDRRIIRRIPKIGKRPRNLREPLKNKLWDEIRKAVRVQIMSDRCSVFFRFFDAALGIHCTSANQITWNFCCHSSQTSFRDYREYLCRYFFRNEKLNLSFTVDQPQMICRLSDIKTTWLLRGVKFFESKVDGNKWRFFYLFSIIFDKNRPFSRTFCYCYSKFLYSTLFTSLLTPLCSFLIVPDCAHTESSLFSSALRFHIFSRIIPCCHLFPLFLHSLRFRFLWTPRF